MENKYYRQPKESVLRSLKVSEEKGLTHKEADKNMVKTNLQSLNKLVCFKKLKKYWDSNLLSYYLLQRVLACSLKNIMMPLGFVWLF